MFVLLRCGRRHILGRYSHLEGSAQIGWLWSEYAADTVYRGAVCFYIFGVCFTSSAISSFVSLPLNPAMLSPSMLVMMLSSNSG